MFFPFVNPYINFGFPQQSCNWKCGRHCFGQCFRTFWQAREYFRSISTERYTDFGHINWTPEIKSTRKSSSYDPKIDLNMAKLAPTKFRFVIFTEIRRHRRTVPSLKKCIKISFIEIFELMDNELK